MGAVNKQAEKVTVIKIDHDYLWRKGDELPSRVGAEWEAIPGFDYDNTWTLHPIADGEKVRFRVKDDDGEIYYGGWLLNDNECINQQVILKWCEHDAGATDIEVKVNDEWITEIG